MDARDEQTVRYSMAAPTVRRLRRISVIILALLVVVVALGRFLSPVRGMDLAAAGAAVAAAAWAGYWAGLDRGLDALATVGAGRLLEPGGPGAAGGVAAGPGGQGGGPPGTTGVGDPVAGWVPGDAEE